VRSTNHEAPNYAISSSTLYPLGPNIFPNTVPSSTLSQCSSRNVRDKVSRQNKQQCNKTGLWNIPRLLHRRNSKHCPKNTRLLPYDALHIRPKLPWEWRANSSETPVYVASYPTYRNHCNPYENLKSRDVCTTPCCVAFNCSSTGVVKINYK